MLLLLLWLNVLGSAMGQSRFWISKAEPIRDELLAVQALIVKDEEVTAGCKAKTNDVRYADKRHLMCAGSILTSRYILTSASCIHEATDIRHNIRGPLAVVIAPFSNTSQIIKVLEFYIHPKHEVDPREDHYTLHNVAIVKLSCKILQRNLKEIKLPDQPLADMCVEDSCVVTVIKTIRNATLVMYETQIEILERDRHQRETMINESINNANATVEKFHVNFGGSVQNKITHNKFNNQITRGNPEIPRNINGRYQIWNRYNILKDIVYISEKKALTRANDSVQGCPKKGSAIMSSNSQTAIISVSCVDKQPETTWQFTDLYDNLDWIHKMIGIKRKPKESALRRCSTCVYNFFIDYNHKDKKMCITDTSPGSIPDNVHSNVPGIVLPKCSKNQTTLNVTGKSIIENQPKFNRSQPHNQAYYEALHKMYLNWYHGTERDYSNRMLTSGNARSLSNREPERIAIESSEPAKAVALSKSLNILLLKLLNAGREKTTTSQPYPERVEALEKVTPLSLDDFLNRMNVHSPEPDEKMNSLVGISQRNSKTFPSNSSLEESVIAAEYATLYRKFLEEFNQSPMKYNGILFRKYKSRR